MSNPDSPPTSQEPRLTSTDGVEQCAPINRFGRRAFLTLAAGSLASCANKSPIPEPLATIGNAPANGPKRNRPIPRNPNMPLPSDFTIPSHDITFTRALVSGKYIAMTFDDGPHPQNTPRLLRILRERNIKATFYVIGRSVEANPQVLQATVNEGHEIGNHSQTHQLLTKIGDDTLRREMESCRTAIYNASGYHAKTMRPPYGALSQRQRQLVYSEFGYPIILWSVDPLDWKRPGPSVVTSRILSHTNAGSIVLAHDLHSQTVSAMPGTLDELLYRGFRFVTVSQLLAMQSEVSGASSPSALLES